MARGWESKSVESQIEDAAARSQAGTALTPEERAVLQKRQGLELSRRRVLNELAAAQSEIRRTALERALAHLEEEIRQLAPGDDARG